MVDLWMVHEPFFDSFALMFSRAERVRSDVAFPRIFTATTALEVVPLNHFEEFVAYRFRCCKHDFESNLAVFAESQFLSQSLFHLDSAPEN